ncbi:MAG: prepilin-type N-terminal cleavage/methylation domain-containing protein [Clostridia bacterium]|nr:prepilin-type N-terminal cleavage/methylation domain-containing protein [Clostridia bacterium]
MKRAEDYQDRTRGFTLIELIVVIAILAILAAILIPSFFRYIGSAKDAAAQADARTAYTALQTVTTLDAAPGIAPTTLVGWNNAIKTYMGNATGSLTLVEEKSAADNTVTGITWHDSNGIDASYGAVTGGTDIN